MYVTAISDFEATLGPWRCSASEIDFIRGYPGYPTDPRLVLASISEAENRYGPHIASKSEIAVTYE